MKKVFRVLAVVAILGVTGVSCSKNHASDMGPEKDNPIAIDPGYDKSPEIENPIAVDPGFDGPGGKEPRQ